MKRRFSGPLLLCIVDGFGIAADRPNNAVSQAKTPVLDALFSEYPHSKLITHGEAVGLPEGQMGNSEVGHMTIGSGRVMKQSLQRITDDFTSGALFKTQTWLELQTHIKKARRVHVVGMVSDGGVHSHMDHILALSKAFPEKEISIHAILDGRDTAMRDAINQLTEFQEKLPQNAFVVTLCGRFYAMDRDGNTQRTDAAIQAILDAKGINFDDPLRPSIKRTQLEKQMNLLCQWSMTHLLV